jgi:hypothetical protein
MERQALCDAVCPYNAEGLAVRELGARMQSTVVAFHRSREVGRSVGDANPDSLKALLDKTIR